MNQKTIIGFAGMTHLGIISSISAASKGYQIIGFQDDKKLIDELNMAILPIEEPQLDELFKKYKELLTFTNDTALLSECDIVYVSVDIPTNDEGISDLNPINNIIEQIKPSLNSSAILVILSQVPPGFTRQIDFDSERLIYQVETLIFGRAVERGLYPERYIIGCANPQLPLPVIFENYLKAFDCPILAMRYESAELAKISINVCLVASVSAANTMAEICEKIGAKWSEIIPALKLDRRIGQYSYIQPGLGISGGNLERDLITVLELAKKNETDGGIVASWVYNSNYRKNWPFKILNEVLLKENPNATIGILGLAYKENTHSIKNSPAIILINNLNKCRVTAYDPIVKTEIAGKNIINASKAIDVAINADALLIMTAWPEFKDISANELAQKMKGKIVIDPYGILDYEQVKNAGLDYFTLGAPIDIKKK
ncbi:MAG: nucleotide sugar dehydrogenase [Bacteroidetes bacterium]|nr:nucleotide sugar dehydrogenase [Bacteroidota bacterium]